MTAQKRWTACLTHQVLGWYKSGRLTNIKNILIDIHKSQELSIMGKLNKYGAVFYVTTN